MRRSSRGDGFALFSRPRPDDVTVFTGDLALLLRTGARINEALELLAADSDIGRMRSTATKVTSAILAGRELRRRNFAPSERISSDLRRARARGRGVGKFGADPRGD